MRTVWKYPVVLPEFEHDMPRGAKPLVVQVQEERPVMWVLVGPDQPLERRRFVSVTTGGVVPDEMRVYVGTFTMNGLVYHLFEVV